MWKKHNISLFFSVLILSVIGFFTIISTNLSPEGDISLSGLVFKHLVFLLTGFGLYFVLSFLNLTYLRHWQVLLVIYLATVVLLILTKLFGPPINSAQRWLFIGGENGFQFQPSEVAKIVVILITASILSMKTKYNDLLLALASFLLVVPILVLIYIQPHGSMTLIILSIWSILMLTFLDNQLRNLLLIAIIVSGGIGMVLISISQFIWGILLVIVAVVISIMGAYSKVKWRGLFLVALGVALVVGFAGGYSWDKVLKPYQQARIQSFIQPSEETEGIDRNIRESKIAIGSGRIFGKGFGFGTQSRLNFIPEHRTDFIFAAYAEQFGLLGSLVLIGLYCFIIARIFTLGMNSSEDIFISVVIIGIGLKIMIEVFINIGTNTGAIPATGIPLPLVSYGGTITLMTLVSLGIIQSLLANRTETLRVENDVDSEELLI